ncbi:hypothetical protein ACFL27_25240 [candidate division CSSED10-310 bacterium]|uniref:DUF1573 domain-containing protein n=1 Tax=candidate division CSSED10-310 bacterium TaxID=2855610 RepID=A0ABV6Z4Y0_UNCC1
MKIKRIFITLGFAALLICGVSLLFCQESISQVKHQAPAFQKTQKTDHLKTTDTSGPPSEIKFDRDDLTYDFGTVAQMSTTEQVIKFKNIGQGTLRIFKVKPG